MRLQARGEQAFGPGSTDTDVATLSAGRPGGDLDK